MKINPKSLMDTGGIDCFYLTALPDGEAVKLPARAAFVTEETVFASRKADVMTDAQGRKGWPDLKYGSVLVSRKASSGQTENKIYQPGQDAGVYLEVEGAERPLGFTGFLMADYRWKLLATPSLRNDPAHKKAILGVSFVQGLIASDPDPNRYPMEVIRDAFLCSLSSEDLRGAVPVDTESFVRKAQSDLLKALISRVQQDHREGMSAKPSSLQSILKDYGVREALNNTSLKDILKESKILSDGVIGTLTRTPVDVLATATLDRRGFTMLRNGMEKKDRLHHGGWPEMIEAGLKHILAESMPGYDFNMIFGTSGGRDLLGIQDQGKASKGVGYIFAWPTADRLPLTRMNKSRTLSLSEADVPSEADLDRLKSIYAEITKTLPEELPENA